MQAHTQGVSVQAQAARQRSSSFTRRVNQSIVHLFHISCFSSSISNVTSVLRGIKMMLPETLFFPILYVFLYFPSTLT